MSLLWSGIESVKLLKNKARPSPKLKKFFYKNAHKNPGDLPGKKSYIDKINSSIEGTSVPVFFNKKVRAGMTVEAAIVFPVFLFFFINLSCAIEMIRLHCNLEAALCNTGYKVSIYGSALISAEAEDVLFSYIYVKNAVIKHAGKEYLDSSPLLYGSDGLRFLESDIFTSNDTFEITMTYAVAPWIQYVGIRPFRMANKYYGHIWNGYDLSNSVEDKEKIQTVYIVENASVYHEDSNCTHIKLAIREVSSFGIESERNIYGNKYTLCERCGKGVMPDKLFVGKEGERYHYREDCPGLTRTVYSMAKEEAELKYNPCSRCSK